MYYYYLYDDIKIYFAIVISYTA